MKLRLFILFLLLHAVAWGQQSFLEIQVTDLRSRELIPNVQLVFQQDSTVVVARTFRGPCKVEIPKTGVWTLRLEHPLYESEQTSITLRGGDDTIRKSYSMAPIRVVTQREVTIRPPGKPAVVFGSEQVSVADFEMLGNGELLLLVYPKRLEKGSELLIQKNGEVISSFKVPEKPRELVRDYRGDIHIVCEQTTYRVQRTGNELSLGAIPKEYFLTYLLPIVDTIQSKLFFSNFQAHFPAFSYTSFDQEDSVYQKIRQIQDDLMMELYRSEYKWVDVRTKLWAREMEQETGVDKEIWVGARYFTQSIYYKELYAPMFRRNDSIFVFDYYKDGLFCYDQFGNLLDSTAIYHHYNPKQTGWQRKLIQDPVTKNVFAVLEKNGHFSVRLVDLRSGTLEDEFPLEHRYVENIQVYNNRIMYVYRPFESLQKKFLYEAKMPLWFQD